MVDGDSGDKGKQDDEQSPAPLSKFSQPPIEPTPAVVPGAVSAGGAPGRAPNGNNGGNTPKQPRKLLVEIVKDEELKPFETQTLRLALWGIAVAAITGAVFYFQFLQMSYQTQIIAAEAESAAAGAAIGELNTRRQLTIAQQQANAATSNATTASNALRMSERAWIGIANAVVVKEETTFPSVISYDIDVTNTGHSPALDVSGLGYDVVEKGRHFRLPDQSRLRNPARSSATMFPGVTIPSPGRHRLTPEEIGAVTADSFFYIYGTFFYKDIFREEHWTHYCYRLDPKMGWGPFHMCDTYNDTDDYPENHK